MPRGDPVPSWTGPLEAEEVGVGAGLLCRNDYPDALGPMKIALTICSNSCLSYADVLAASLKQQNPEYTFVAALVEPQPSGELCPLPI
jgi:hypothetical protein